MRDLRIGGCHLTPCILHPSACFILFGECAFTGVRHSPDQGCGQQRGVQGMSGEVPSSLRVLGVPSGDEFLPLPLQRLRQPRHGVQEEEEQEGGRDQDPGSQRQIRQSPQEAKEKAG